MTYFFKEIKVKQSKFTILGTVILSFFLLTGFGLGDVNKKMSSSLNNSSKSSSKSKNREAIKTGVKVVAIGIAAKLLKDLVVEFTSEKTEEEDAVVKEYKKAHKKLPKKPKVVSYTTKISPSGAVKAGKKVSVFTTTKVVPGTKVTKVEVQDKLEIYDAENTAQINQSLVKPVNEGSPTGGTYSNKFVFSLPEGLPQGVYPVKTTSIVNGEEQDNVDNKFQLVLTVMPDHQYQLALANQ